MQIPVKTTKGKFFREYVELLNPVLRLRKRDLDVLSELLQYNNKLLKIPPKERWNLIFNYDAKLEMSTKLGMSRESFAMHLSNLRRKKVIINNKVIDMLCVDPGKQFNVEYNFHIKDERTADQQSLT